MNRRPVINSSDAKLTSRRKSCEWRINEVTISFSLGFVLSPIAEMTAFVNVPSYFAPLVLPPPKNVVGHLEVRETGDLEVVGEV